MSIPASSTSDGTRLTICLRPNTAGPTSARLRRAGAVRGARASWNVDNAALLLLPTALLAVRFREFFDLRGYDGLAITESGVSVGRMFFRWNEISDVRRHSWRGVELRVGSRKNVVDGCDFAANDIDVLLAIQYHKRHYGPTAE